MSKKSWVTKDTDTATKIPGDMMLGLKWVTHKLRSGQWGNYPRVDYSDHLWKKVPRTRCRIVQLCSGSCLHWFRSYHDSNNGLYTKPRENGSSDTRSVLVLVVAAGPHQHGFDKSGSAGLRVVRVLGRGRHAASWYVVSRFVRLNRKRCEGSVASAFVRSPSAKRWFELRQSGHPADREILRCRFSIPVGSPDWNTRPVPRAVQRAFDLVGMVDIAEWW